MKIKSVGPERRQAASLLLLVLVCAAAGFGGGYVGSNARFQVGSPNGSAITKENQKAVLSESELISAIAKKAAPSVVSINVTVEVPSQLDFFGFGGADQQIAAGTGMIISQDGYVMTNRHVVPANANGISVTLSDGTKFDNVELVGRTNDGDSLDVAFLKIKDTKGKKLEPITFGDSGNVQVGDKVVAIGNALGQFQNTVTSGIISGFGRNVRAGDASGFGAGETLQNLFQTDAAINQGNSGGPLLNINGEVIGINTAIAGGSAQNIGFALPSNDLQSLIKSVLTKGKLERPYLGVRFVTLTDDYAYEYNLSTKRGAYIPPSRGSQSSIIPNSPASKAGLKEKDIIIKIDGTAIDEKNSLTSLIGRKNVGDEVALTVVRDGKEQTIKVKLEAVPQN